MTGVINTVISVYMSTDKNGGPIALCFPSGDIVVPPDCVATIDWKTIVSPSGKPAPQFYKDTIVPTSSDPRVQITKPASTTSFVDTFVLTINNGGTGGQDIATGVNFRVNYAGALPNAPPVTAGGTIRNKGTSIWVERLVPFAAGLLLASLGTWIARHLFMGPG